jgi:hypothetical protein
MISSDYDLVSGWEKKRYDPVAAKNLPSIYLMLKNIWRVQLNDFN